MFHGLSNFFISVTFSSLSKPKMLRNLRWLGIYSWKEVHGWMFFKKYFRHVIFLVFIGISVF